MIAFFADTGFLVGWRSKEDQYHKQSQMIYKELKDTFPWFNCKNLYVTNFILVEVFQILQNNIGFLNARDFHRALLDKCSYFEITPRLIEEAIEKKMSPFCNHRTGNPSIGLVDATTLVAMDECKIAHIISYDEDFDNIPLILKISSSKSLDCFQL